MATKPSTIPTWATNANYSTGDYAGSATKVDPSAVRADGHLPNTAPLAEHENFDRNLIGQWIAFLNDLHGSTEFLNKGYVWTGNHRFTSVSGVVAGGVNGGFRSLAGFFFSDSSGNLDYRSGKVFLPVLDDTNETGSGWSDGGGVRQALPCSGQTKKWYYRIPAGSRVSAVNLLLARAATPNTSTLNVRLITYDDTTPANPSLGTVTTATVAAGTGTAHLSAVAPSANAWRSLGNSVLEVEFVVASGGTGACTLGHLRLLVDESEVTSMG